MVNIALNGDTSPSTCSGVEQWCNAGPVRGVGITCVIDAVYNALQALPDQHNKPQRLSNHREVPPIQSPRGSP